MLYAIDGNGNVKRIDHIPYAKDYQQWKSKLTPDEYQSIEDAINDLIDGDEIHTSSWMPGSDWTGTAFMPIYDKACKRDTTAAGLFFGLIVYKVVMERPDKWSFGRYEKDGIPIKGMTYFRIK